MRPTQVRGCSMLRWGGWVILDQQRVWDLRGRVLVVSHGQEASCGRAAVKAGARRPGEAVPRHPCLQPVCSVPFLLRPGKDLPPTS